MDEAVHPPRLVRFGTFEVDLPAGELRKGGLKLKLTGQPFQVLAILLERPGELVTREELQTRLWPDTFVDVDHNLNAAINKIREVLGDSAETPRFVETVPRRGYRFIAPVNGNAASSQTNVVLVTSGSSFVADRPGGASFRFLPVLAILLSIVAVTLVWWLSTKPIPKITGSKRLTFTGQVVGPRYPFGWAETFPGLATDGNRVYYSSLQQFRDRLSYVSVFGGDQVVLSVPLFASVRHISPDGSTLLAHGVLKSEAEEHLWFVPTAGGGPQRVAIVDGQDGAWSADGSRIAYANGVELFVGDKDGSNSHKIATASGKAFWLRWSPDSERIRFTVVDQKNGKSALWECRSDGTDLHPLWLSGDNQAEECCGEWTQHGRYFLFRVFRNNHADIWALRETRFKLFAAKPIRLTTGPLDSMDAIPSNDGRQLLTLEAQPGSELHSFDLNTHQLTRYLPGAFATDTRRIPGTDQIVYIESRGKETKLWRSLPDGNERLQLTGPPLLVFRIAPSPDGKHIALMAKMPDERWRVYLVPSGGGPLRALTPEDENVADPTWSPDGREILFGAIPRWWPGGSKPTLISTLNIDSGQIATVPDSEGLFSPRWSPDGRYIAAMTQDWSKLMLFDFAKKRWLKLAGGDFDFPEWHPNSEYIYVTDRSKNPPKLMRVRRVDGKADQVLDLESVNPKAQVCWMITPPEKDSLLISCTVPAGDIYALDMDLP